MEPLKNRMLKAQNRIKELDSVVFFKKDLRGLSSIEKQFIVENDYKIVFKQTNTIGTNGNVYLFIAKNKIGKKQLYAITKKQSISPNGHDISQSAFNYECWLLLDAQLWCFSKFNYERRFCTTPNTRMIFA